MRTKFLLLITLLVSVFAFSSSAQAAFSDVPEDHPYAGAIQFAKEAELITPFANNNFRPDLAITRAEFVEMLMKAVLTEEIPVIRWCFADVTGPAEPAICTAKAIGIVEGAPQDGLFHPDDNTSVAGAAVLTSRAWELATNPYAGGHWYLRFVQAVRSEGAFPSTAEGQFHRPITRAEAVYMIHQMALAVGLPDASEKTIQSAQITSEEPITSTAPEEEPTPVSAEANTIRVITSPSTATHNPFHRSRVYTPPTTNSSTPSTPAISTANTTTPAPVSSSAQPNTTPTATPTVTIVPNPIPIAPSPNPITTSNPAPISSTPPTQAVVLPTPPPPSTPSTPTPSFTTSASLKSRLTHTIITLPAPLAAATRNFCTWGGCALSPRLYHTPLQGDQTLVGWTDSSGNGHVSLIEGSSLLWTIDFPNYPVRGLVGRPDNRFAILLWNQDQFPARMMLSKREANGDEMWTTDLFSGIAVPDFRDIGDSRLSYGNGRYAAHFSVQGISGSYGGHNADQLTYVDDAGTTTGGRNWGCSHSFAQLIDYHPTLDAFAPICVSDGFPSKGIILNNNHQLYRAGADGSKHVSAQLGQLAHGDNDWKLLFNALNRPCCEGRGIGLASFGTNGNTSITWLTNTQGEHEWDPAIARLGTGPEQFLVGWRTTNNRVYHIGIIDKDGSFLKGPEEITSAGAWWGRRDDSFRPRADGSVSWVVGGQQSNQLHLFLFR